MSGVRYGDVETESLGENWMPPASRYRETTFRFAPCLDGRAALHARALIESAPPDAELVLDFTRVRDVEYMALATVIVAIARRRGRPVALRGLCDQHLRVLRYLGLDVDRLAPREAQPAHGSTVASLGQPDDVAQPALA